MRLDSHTAIGTCPSMSAREKALVEAAAGIKADLELRADFEEDNTVAVGSGVWSKLCEALAAYEKDY